MKIIITPSFFAMVLISVLAGSVSAAARFEPPEGKVLLIMGQTQEDIQAYLNVAQVLPAGLMGYTAIHSEGIDSPFNQGAGTQYLQKLAKDYPGVVLQIGLYLVNTCSAIAHGSLDSDIDRLGDWIQKSRRPIFLRIGYEFDGPHNHYPAEDYIQAYRHIVERLRSHGVTNAAYVWHSYASAGSQALANWYPGDEYVDWVGISYFNQPQHYMKPVLEFARRKEKPVMICELSPATFKTQYANAWNLWFVPLFKFIGANNVKAVSYISCNWDAWPQFAKMHWGETRLQANPYILRHWLEETAKDRYLKASPELFRLLGFDDPAVVTKN